MAQYIKAFHTGQHQVEYDECEIVRKCALQSTLSMVNGFNGKILCTETLSKKPAKLHIVIDDEHASHSHTYQPRIPILVHRLSGISGLYKTLYSLTNLYRMLRGPMLESSCGKKGDVAMRRIAIWLCAVVLLAVAGVAIAGANVRGWNGCSGHR